MDKIDVLDRETVEDLDGYQIIQHKDKYRFSSDAVLLANFVVQKPREKIVELCAGSGVISLLLVKRGATHIQALEIQPYMAELAQRNVRLNGLEDIIKVFLGDANNILDYISPNSADVVVCNPPYRKANSGDVSKNMEIAISRAEILLTLPQMIASAKKALRFGGRLYFCCQCERLAESIILLHEQGFAPKQILPVCPKQNTDPYLFLMEAVVGGRSGCKLRFPQIAKG